MAFNFWGGNMDINEFVKGINDPRLMSAVKRLGATPEGQRLLNSITEQDRQRLLKQLGGLSANGITNELLLQQLNNNPDILNKLSSFLNKR